MLYLGIDQHRKQLTVSLRNERGDVVLKRQVSTEWNRVKRFFEEVAEVACEEGGFVAILEVCGFNDWLLRMLAEYGCRDTVLVQPETRSKKKTDRRDADQLGQLLWVNRERLLEGKRVHGLRRVLLPTQKDAENRQLTTLRQRLGQLRARTMNKVQRILLKHNLQQECPNKGIRTKTARKWLRELVLDEIDRMEMDLLLAQWQLWDEQIKEVDAMIDQRTQDDEVATILCTVPGMHFYSSLVVASRIGSIEKFRRPGSLANYWGLTPGCRNSGDATSRLGSITKQGSRIVRFVLGQVILHVLRRDRAVKAWYSRIKKRRGSKIARVAVMRRLATIIWHMIKHKQGYRIGQMMRPSRLEQQDTTADQRCRVSERIARGKNVSEGEVTAPAA